MSPLPVASTTRRAKRPSEHVRRAMQAPRIASLPPRTCSVRGPPLARPGVRLAGAAQIKTDWEREARAAAPLRPLDASPAADRSRLVVGVITRDAEVDGSGVPCSTTDRVGHLDLPVSWAAWSLPRHGS